MELRKNNGKPHEIFCAAFLSNHHIFPHWQTKIKLVSSDQKKCFEIYQKMSEKKFNVNDLRVAAPCHIGWETMAGDERKRFCQSCRLNVYNISAMTAREAEDFITKAEGRVCIRLYKRADGTVLTRDCPTGLRLYRKRVGKFAGAVFAAIVGLFSVSFGQTDANKAESCKIVKQGKIFREQTKSELVTIKGIVQDMNGAVIPGITVSLINNDTKQEYITISSDEGEYKFDKLPDGNYSITFKKSGFKEYKIENFALNKMESVQLEAMMQLEEGTVIVGIYAEPGLIDMTKSDITHTITREMIDRIPH